MTLTRRKTLALLGGGTLFAATAGAASIVTRSPADALAPWAAAGGYADPVRRALSYALLAPNPHNRQPWLVDLATPDTAVLYVDPERLLPHTDPLNRQITIGLGCFLEIMRLAALEDGMQVTFDLFPDGADAAALDTRPVAICRFARSDAPRDPLFAQVPHRRSLKEPYDMARPLDPAHLAHIRRAVQHTAFGMTTDADEVQALRDLSVAAFEIEFATARTYKESVDLFRIGAREVNANPDGIDFTGPMFETLRLTGLFSRREALSEDSFSKKQALQMISETMQTAMGHLWIVTEGNSRVEQIRAGQDWVRLNLAATEMGVGLQPLSQALQEFPEMSALYEDAHARLAPGGGTVQMWARMGYGPEVPQSPRWPLEAKLVQTR